MSSETLTLIGAVSGTILGSNTLFAFIQFLIQRKDNKNDKIKEIKENIDKKFKERDEKNKEIKDYYEKSIEELRAAMIALADDAEDRKKLEGCMAKSLMALSHDKLVRLGKFYQKRGAITLAEKNNIKLIFEPYHNGLGGNSDGEGYYDFCMHLPVVTEEEAMEMDCKNKSEVLRQLNSDFNF